MTVQANTTTTAADITVPDKPSPTLNALVLGVADISASGGSAASGGDIPLSANRLPHFTGPGCLLCGAIDCGCMVWIVDDADHV